MMGRYKIDLYAKDLAYRALQPVARELGMQLLILDPKTYRTMLDFDKRLKRFGISPSEVSKLQREMDDGSTVAIFKSKKYYGAPEIAPHFAKWNLDEDAINYMRSVNADKHEVWGDFSNDIPESKRMFLYWINVDVLDENGNVVLESAKNEWKVKFTDDEEDGEQIASFDSEKDASNWIKCQEINDRYEPHHFEVVDGPYRETSALHETCQKMKSLLEKLLATKSWQKLEESVASSKADPKAVQYVKDFKDFFGYKDDYMPKKSYSKEMDSLAAECALRMPTDTAAREIEGDAVMLLVLSGEEDAVKAGKKLGDCMMKKGKHDEETLLKRMSDAYIALQGLWSKHERDIEESEDTTMKKQYTKEQITEAIAYWEKQLKMMNESEDKDRKAELDAFAQTICGFITKAVMSGLWKPEYEGEQPTRDRIEASLPWAMLPGVTAEEKSYVMNIVYPKLRKNSIFSKMKKKMAGEEVNESVVSFEDPDEITIHQMLKEARKLFPHNSDGGKLSPIVGIVDGYLADFTHCTFAKHENFPDGGTFFLHDGTQASLDALEEQLTVLHYREDSKQTLEAEENPDDAKADDLFIKGDEYEEELKAKAELAKDEENKKDARK